MQAGDAIVKVADGRPSDSPSPGSTRCSTCPTSRARCWNGRCGCRRSARDGRAASATCSPRPTARGPAAPRGPGSGPCASRRSVVGARPSPRSGSSRPTTRRRARASRPGSTSPCACSQTATARRSPAATRCRTCPANAATGSASSARVKRAATCIGPQGRRSARRRRPAGQLRPARQSAPRRAAGRRGRRDPGVAMLHALAREQTTRPVWWVARGAQPRRPRLRRRGRRAARRSRRRPPGRGLHRRRRAREAPGSSPKSADARSRGPRSRRRCSKDEDYYLCGPEGVMKGISAALIARGRAGATPGRRRPGRRPRPGLGPTARSACVIHGARQTVRSTMTFAHLRSRRDGTTVNPTARHREACEVPVGFAAGRRRCSTRCERRRGGGQGSPPCDRVRRSGGGRGRRCYVCCSRRRRCPQLDL